MEEDIIFRLQVDPVDSEKKQIELQKAINSTKNELAGLDKTSADYAKRQVELNTQLKSLTREQGLHRKSLEDTVKATKAAEGSNDQLRAKLSEMTRAYNSLGREMRNSVEGQKFAKEIRAISDELKRNEAAVGDNRRNVGNYAESLGKAIPSLKGFTSGIDATGAAFRANPIGFFADLVLRLLMHLKNIQPVMDAVEQATSAINTAFSVVVDTAAAMVTTIKQNLSPALSALGKIVRGDASGFTDLWNIGKKVVGNMTDVASTTLEAGKAAAQLARDTQALNREEIRLITVQAQRREQLVLLKKTLEDVSLSEAARQANSRAAQALQRQILADDIKVQTERVRILEETQKLSSNTLEDDRKIAEERAKLFQLQAQALGEIQELRNKEAKLSKAEAARAAAERKQFTEEELRHNQAVAKRKEEADQAIAEAEQRLKDKRNADMDAYVAKLTAQSKLEKEIREDEIRWAELAAERKIAAKEAETAAEWAAMHTTLDIARALAGMAAEQSSFTKAIALFQIAIDMAESISAIAKTATKVAGEVAEVSGPAGLFTGPVAFAAYYGANITSLLGSMKKAYALLNTQIPTIPTLQAPTPRFEQGGYTGAGNPKQESYALGPKPYIYHKDEYVIPSPVLNTAEGAELAARAERLRKHIPRVHVPRGFANGGFTPGSQGPVLDYNQLAKAIAKQPISVSVKEINTMQGRVAQVKDSTSI